MKLTFQQFISYLIKKANKPHYKKIEEATSVKAASRETR